MSLSKGRGSTQTSSTQSWATFCAALPGRFLSTADLPQAEHALQSILAATHNGLVPGPDAKPDAIANLWFMRAAHLFANAGGNPAFFNDHLLPLCQKIVMEFISPGGLGGILMDDGGLLIPPSRHASSPKSAAPALIFPPALRINALWYSGLETTGVKLKTAGDRAGDHFERLAGRFRRSFAKSYWCDHHACVCLPEEKIREDHAAQIPTIHPDQLLLTFLPASPIPRTKQRQLLAAIRTKSLGPIGLFIEHPRHGPVESVLHRAWMVSGLLVSADARNTALPDAMEIASALMSLQAVNSTGIPALYKNGQPLDAHPDPLTTAEVQSALAMLRSN